MESKEIRDLMEAYYSIYEAKEEPEMEEGEEDEEEEYKGKKKGKKEKEEKGEDEDEEEMEEGVSYSAKKARAGEDIGKPGKMFGKIAKEAGKRYGSKERGEKVAGAVLAGLREGTDLFDYLLEYLVAEGYADTNQAAIAIMANMSEEWRQSIVEDAPLRDEPLWDMAGDKPKAKPPVIKKPQPQVKKEAPMRDEPLW